MPPKRGKSKTSFKIFSTANYSKFANRFPFLKERQIKAKLLQAWRNQFTSNTTKEIKKSKHRNETLFNGVKCETPGASQEDGFKNRSDCSLPKYTYSNRRHNDKVRHGFAKEKPSQSVANCSSPCSSEASFRGSGSSNLDGDKVLKKRKATQGRKANELIDLFEEISAEQLLIEPGENYVANSEVMLSTPVCEFNRKEWLEKLEEEAKDEKNPNTVSGMFKWRADRKRKISQKKEEENSYESRFLVSNDREGRSNFLSMFDGEEDIFL